MSSHLHKIEQLPVRVNIRNTIPQQLYKSCIFLRFLDTARIPTENSR